MKWLSSEFSHSLWELQIQRVMLAIVVLNIGKRNPHFSGQPSPNGFAQFVDFTFLSDPHIFAISKGLLLAAIIIYVWGKYMPICVGYMLFHLTALGTLRNSQGAIGHATQIVALVLLGQFCAYLHSLWQDSQKTVHQKHEFATLLTNEVIAGSYVVAGLVKLIKSGISLELSIPLPGWIVDSPKIAVEIIRTHNEQYYNILDPDILQRGEAIANWIVANPNLARILFSGGLFLELFAFIALLGRKWSFFIGVSLILLHVGIYELMALNFKYNIQILLIFFVNVPFLIAYILKRIRFIS